MWFMNFNDVPHWAEKQWNWGGERRQMGNVLRHGCGNLIENKIRVNGIYHNEKKKKFFLNVLKAKLDKTWYANLFNSTIFACDVICKQNMGYYKEERGARGVMVIVAGYGHGDTSSNPGPDWLHFT